MRLIAALAIVAALSCGRAEAQPAPWAPERLTAGWTFLPAVTFGAMFDNNVTVQNAGGTGANATLSEWVGLVGPRGELLYNGRQTRFNAGYSGSFERYRELNQLNRYAQRARATARHTASRQLELSALMSWRAAPTTEDTDLDLGAVPFVRIGSQVVEAGGAATYVLTRRAKLEAAYRFQKVEFDRNQTAQLPAVLLGGYSNSPSIGVQLQMTSRLTVGGSYDYRHAIIGAGASRFVVQNALADLRYRLSANTVFSGSLGAARLDVAAPAISLWGPTTRASLEHDAGPAQLSLRYERSFIPAFSFGGLTSNQYLSAGAAAPLTRGGRLTLSGNATYRRTEPIQELGTGIRLDSVRIGSALGYQISRWLRSDLFVSSTFQKTDARGDIDRTRVGIQFTTSKPVRIQ